MKKYLYVLAFIAASGLFVSSEAQTPSTSTQPAAAGVAAAAAQRVLGEVTAIDPAARQITLSAAAGQKVLVKLDDKTIFRRVPPGEKTLDKAIEIAFGDIGVGDRVRARGTAPGEQKEVLLAREVIVMSKAEITLKRERDRAEWLRRGIVGVVAAINPASREITLRMQAAEGNQSVVITPADGVRFRRYAPDSVNFSDARPGSFEDLKVGDQLRALGEKSSDGASYKAEEVVSGTFRTIGGTVVGAPAAGELTIKDIKTNQLLTVVVAKDSVLRRFTPELVKLLEQRAANSSSSGGGGQAGGDLQNMIESLPPIAATDLKPGDAILISSSAAANTTRVTAVLIAAGMEDFFKRQAKTGVQRELNLGLGLPAGVLP